MRVSLREILGGTVYFCHDKCHYFLNARYLFLEWESELC